MDGERYRERHRERHRENERGDTESEKERNESRTNRCYDGEADGFRQRRVGHEPARLSDAPHHTRQYRRQDGLGVDTGSVAHVDTVQNEVDGARSKDPAEMAEHVVETCNTWR